MILEYTPYRACELIIKTLVSVRNLATINYHAHCLLDFDVSCSILPCSMHAGHETCTPCVQAGANAKENLGLKKLKLVVSECYCDEGPILKRIKTRAKGR